MTTKEPVSFMMRLEESVDKDNVTADLEKLTKDIKVRSFLKEICLLVCETNQQTYEKIFGAKLKYTTRTVNEAVGRPQEISDYEEVQKAKIPDSLKGKVRYLELNRKAYPC
ncbi:hypothetical protein HY484_04675 [Candidatus Woesearchaeota archaeon]|nr:hypothetical protein [Candidatus Woesearchaeota archaeon]